MNSNDPINGFVIRTFDRDILITQKQRDFLCDAMDSGIKYFDVVGGRVMVSQIKEIVPTCYKVPVSVNTNDTLIPERWVA